MTRQKRAFALYVLSASVLCLVAFLFSYEASVLGAPSAVLYIADFFLRLVDMLLPMTAAAVLLPRLCALPPRGILWRSLVLATPSVYAAVLDQYLFLMDSGLDSVDAILLGALFAMLEMLVLFLVYLCLFFVLRYLLRLKEKKTRTPITSELPRTPFDGRNILLIAIAVFGAPQLLLSLVSEIVDIVSFLSTYFTTFSVGEVLYMAFSFLFIPLSYLLCLYLSVYLCLSLIKASQTEPPLPRA